MIARNAQRTSRSSWWDGNAVAPESGVEQCSELVASSGENPRRSRTGTTRSILEDQISINPRDHDPRNTWRSQSAAVLRVGSVARPRGARRYENLNLTQPFLPAREPASCRDARPGACSTRRLASAKSSARIRSARVRSPRAAEHRSLGRRRRETLDRRARTARASIRSARVDATFEDQVRHAIARKKPRNGLALVEFDFHGCGEGACHEFPGDAQEQRGSAWRGALSRADRPASDIARSERRGPISTTRAVALSLPPCSSAALTKRDCRVFRRAAAGQARQ